MAHSGSVQIIAKRDSVEAFSKTIEKSGDILKSLDTVVSAGTTETKSISGDRSQMRLIVLGTDYPVTITAYDSDDVQVGDAISLGAGEALEWYLTGPHSTPFSGDFSYLTIEETGGENDATVKGFILEESA